MQKSHISIGVIIAICLLVYWWVHDHPSAQPVRQGSLSVVSSIG